MTRNKAIIIIPVTGSGAEIVTNGINILTIINVLRSIEAGFCKKLVEEARHAVGESKNAQEQYLDKLIKQAAIEEGRKGNDGLKSRDILGLN